MFLAIIPSTAFTQTLLQAKIAAIAQDAHGTYVSGVDRIDDRYGAFQGPAGHARPSPVAGRAESADGWIELGAVFAR